MNNKLYVITPIFNPRRYKSRIKLYNDFVQYMKPFEDRGEIELYTVEVAYRDRPFEVTLPNNPKHLQLRSEMVLWIKENCINACIQRLPSDWKYMAFIDADIQFARQDWATETVQLLQHYDWLQLFSQAIDLTPDYEILKTHTSLIKAWKDHKLNKTNYSNYLQFHSGFAHAVRRDALDSLGGLFSESILGAGDRNMVTALLGNCEVSLAKGLTENYVNCLRAWQDRATRFINRNVSYLPGVITHAWHGKKVDRRYVDRWKILVNNQFDPTLDLIRDTQGIWRLSHRNQQLHYDIEDYFSARSEDSIDL